MGLFHKISKKLELGKRTKEARLKSLDHSYFLIGTEEIPTEPEKNQNGLVSIIDRDENVVGTASIKPIGTDKLVVSLRNDDADILGTITLSVFEAAEGEYRTDINASFLGGEYEYLTDVKHAKATLERKYSIRKLHHSVSRKWIFQKKETKVLKYYVLSGTSDLKRYEYEVIEELDKRFAGSILSTSDHELMDGFVAGFDRAEDAMDFTVMSLIVLLDSFKISLYQSD